MQKARKTLLIPQGTKVGVGRGSEFPLDFFLHTMKQDMKMTYPAPNGAAGSMVLERADNIDNLDAAQSMVLKALEARSPIWLKTGQMITTFYDILQFGWDILVTGNEEYPFLIVNKSDVEETEEIGPEEQLLIADDLERLKRDLGYDGPHTTISSSRQWTMPPLAEIDWSKIQKQFTEQFASEMAGDPWSQNP